MILFKTVMGEAEAEQVIEKSRFIGYIKPVETREEAEAFIASIKSMHKAATHNVPAYVLGDKAELQWASDDGEPSGTSGAPMLHMLVNEGITNAAIVVTRYFGGIKLGTGGLVRAYTGTAKLVMNEAGICEVRERSVMSFRLDYTYFGKLQNIAASSGFEIKETKFTDMVDIDIECDIEQTERVTGLLTELTSGACTSENIICRVIRGKRKV